MPVRSFIHLVVASIILTLLSEGNEGALLHITPGPFGSGKAYVECSFDGITQNCFLDTGSAITLLPEHTARHYLPLGTFAFKGASGRLARSEVIQIEQAKLDGRIYRHVRIGRFSDRVQGTEVESSIGMDLLGRQPFALQFRDSPQLHLSAQEPAKLYRNLRVAPHNLLEIPLELGSERATALVDTGASVTAVDSAFIRAHPELFRPLKKQTKMVDGAGQSMSVEFYRAKLLRVGERTFHNVVVISTDLRLLREGVSPGLQIVLGFNVLRTTDWYFDPLGKTWAVR